MFHSEFKAKNIKFHYAMDVSYEEQNVDNVVADLNRMKQGRKGTSIVSKTLPDTL